MHVVNLERPFHAVIVGPSGNGPKPFYWKYENDLGHWSNYGWVASREEAEKAAEVEASRIRMDVAMGSKRLHVYR